MDHVIPRPVALILGGSRGIGAAISQRLASGGAAVAVVHLDRSDDAKRLADSLGGTSECLLIQADVTDQRALDATIDAVETRFGRLDILVCCAGLAITGPLADYTLDDFDRMFALNVRAPFQAAQRAAAIMTSGGRIVMIGSIVADHAPGAGATLYAASKAALGGMVRGLARDLGPREITANLVQPGPIDTERNPADGPNAEINRGPLAIRRHGRADEVAALVAYLVSAEAGFVTGATYDIDGGWRA